MRKLIIFSIALFASLSLFSQNPEAYIKKYNKLAVSEMHRSGVPAAITLAQGILESASGTSKLAVKGNNHFGIKKGSGWKGPTIKRKGAKYRKYKSPEQSFRDHSDFLRNGKNYQFLFKYKKTDYKKWAKGLKKAGYARDGKYPKKLRNIIEKYDLNKYSKM